jgi:hypothetical protein
MPSKGMKKNSWQRNRNKSVAFKKKSTIEFKQEPLLSQAECAEIRHRVVSLQRHWQPVKRDGPLREAPFFRLGSSFESDPRTLTEYRRNFKKMNPVMLEHFSELYRKVTCSLSEILENQVVLHSSASVPGFHIMVSDRRFLRHHLPWHIDLDSARLNWQKRVREGQITTMTLPVSLPSGGASLEIKDLFYHPSLYNTVEQDKILERTPIACKIKHKLGYALVQDGQRFHRIGLWQRPLKRTDYRITLQCYLVQQGKRWLAHW